MVVVVAMYRSLSKRAKVGYWNVVALSNTGQDIYPRILYPGYISNYWIYDLDIYPFAKMDIGSGYISKNLQLHHIISISKIAPINTHFWQVFLEYFAFFRPSGRHIEQKQAFFYQLLISTSHLCNEMKCRCLFTIHCH